MSATGMVLAGKAYTTPGPLEFFLPDFTGKHWNDGGYNVLLTKASVLLVLGAVLAYWFLAATSRRQALVPTKGQYLGELAYSFIRNGVAQDIIGAKQYRKYVPLLVSLFFFVLFNNLFGIVPFLTFSTFSRASFAYGLALLVWVIYNGVGVADKGFFGYLKHVTVPSGVPKVMLILLIPLEFFSNILVRPMTLSLRLFANMFAGHLLLVLFSTGGAWLLVDATGSIVLKPAGILAYLLGIAIGFLEVIVAVLQAYVFTLLTATYIGGSLAADH
ncbi:F0F1 ATP synthase subunit A [Jatrophihabitans telluris]|uniref:ATP synthase subunit a n=1 Tax=Jatrophihabitans telluris TaxID=2038343 RepID=A0ABY4R370_9ACTN|nr:F0F1 ATP synthase subunit A [Jatrophihabitans telluris]UQX89863.1 F0F1 ATP synthase subunit A [Jatrophihabitans telluris]